MSSELNWTHHRRLIRAGKIDAMTFYIKEAVETVKKAAMIVPDVRYIGWDVAITEKGPAIIEGNNYAAYDFPQLPDRSQNKEGLLKLLRNAGIKI